MIQISFWVFVSSSSETLSIKLNGSHLPNIQKFHLEEENKMSQFIFINWIIQKLPDHLESYFPFESIIHKIPPG